MLENNEGRTGRFIIQELAQPYTGTPEFQEIYRKFAKRILWIDDDVCPGAFQMNTAWYFAVPERDPIFDEHVHEYDELIGFFGSDPTDPYDLNAELEVTLDGETHRITRSSLIFCLICRCAFSAWTSPSSTFPSSWARSTTARPTNKKQEKRTRRLEGDGVFCMLRGMGIRACDPARGLSSAGRSAAPAGPRSGRWACPPAPRDRDCGADPWAGRSACSR